MKKLFTLFLLSQLVFLTEIQAQGITEGLVLDLPFNGNANDNTVSFLTGTVKNAVLIDGHDSLPNSAYSFNGNNAYIIYPHSEVTVS